MLKTIVKSTSKIFRASLDAPNFLFHGDDALFKLLVRDANLYGEYGVGKSTKWVLKHTDAKIVAVDTSKKWIMKVQKNNQSPDRLDIHHSDLGTVGFMGRPRSYSRHENFADYTDYIWRKTENPDLILIDGRFRVCCFLTCLKYGDEGTKILFDDYVNRPHYHFIERHVSRAEECGRQALFVIPPKERIDMKELDNDITAFRFVMD